MSLAEILLLSLALGVDAFTVGAAVGLRHHSPRQVFRLAWHFGLFQSLMPLAGILAGHVTEGLVRSFSHWISFGLLAWVGGRMILESLRPTEAFEDKDPTKGLSLIVLSLAVSIDAFAVGISFGLTGVSFALPVVLIGVVAGVMTLLGIGIAGRVGAALGRRCGLVAGVVLVGLGVKILVSA